MKDILRYINKHLPKVIIAVMCVVLFGCYYIMYNVDKEVIFVASGGQSTPDRALAGTAENQTADAPDINQHTAEIGSPESGRVINGIDGKSLYKDTSVSAKININTANTIILQSLPGIGEVIAADIILYRETHGDFETIEEIMNVKRIGEKTFENLRDLICVD